MPQIKDTPFSLCHYYVQFKKNLMKSPQQQRLSNSILYGAKRGRYKNRSSSCCSRKAPSCFFTISSTKERERLPCVGFCSIICAFQPPNHPLTHNQRSLITRPFHHREPYQLEHFNHIQFYFQCQFSHIATSLNMQIN